jgi:hypothetical protein
VQSFVAYLALKKCIGCRGISYNGSLGRDRFTIRLPTKCKLLIGYKQKHYLLRKFEEYAKCFPGWEEFIHERELNVVWVFGACLDIGISVCCTQCEEDALYKITKITHVIVCYFGYFGYPSMKYR